METLGDKKKESCKGGAPGDFPGECVKLVMRLPPQQQKELWEHFVQRRS